MWQQTPPSRSEEERQGVQMQVILQAIPLIHHSNSNRVQVVMVSQVETAVRKQGRSTATDVDSQVTWSEIALRRMMTNRIRMLMSHLVSRQQRNPIK